MNKYWLIFCGIVVLAFGYFCEQYGEDRIKVQCDKFKETQQQVTIEAEKHVVGQLRSQANINQGAENAFQKNADFIGALYSNGLQPIPAATSPGLRAVPGTPGGITTSKKYRLTFQQCDIEEAKFIALWNDWLAQAALN